MTSKEMRACGIPEFSEMFCVSKDTVKRAVKQGFLRTIRVGGRVLIPIDEIERVRKP
jgi:excisionase family DNA binding protein